MDKKIWIILAIAVVMSGIYLLTPETRTVPEQVPYQEAVYKTVEKTVLVNETRTEYKTEYLYSGRVGIDTVRGATNYIAEKTGKIIVVDLYRITVFWGSGSRTWENVIDWTLNKEPVQVPYQVTVTVPKVVKEQVLDHYETKYRTEYHTYTKSKIAWILGV